MNWMKQKLKVKLTLRLTDIHLLNAVTSPFNLLTFF